VPSAGASLGLTRVSAEREAVLKCLRESHYNISECARRLDVSRVTVYRLCKKHKLELDGLRDRSPSGTVVSLAGSPTREPRATSQNI
jgi:transposase-like protein